MLLLGFDIGSSFIKGALVEAESGRLCASVAVPEQELKITSPCPGWAEQDPAQWWQGMQQAVAALRRQYPFAPEAVGGIGLSYQMHGLVLIDRQGRVLRPAIIWCDSRAVSIGARAFQTLGVERCLRRLLNSPGNFTATRLRWVRENEPACYRKAYKWLLPGDYVAFCLTGEPTTTVSGLSEGICWDFLEEAPAYWLLDYLEIDRSLMPRLVPTFGLQGELTRTAAEALGLKPGTPVAYRAGDQPNNAFSLGVLHPGQVATTAGTSGVIYAVDDTPRYDSQTRVNTFVHVNHSSEQRRYGILLCLNGTGILYRWLREVFGGTLSYAAMNEEASAAPVGSDGLCVLPFGNGAERMLRNQTLGASIHGLDFNRHGRAHLLRAAKEGIAFALAYGLEIIRRMGLTVEKVRAGRANLFLSPLFSRIYATVNRTVVELYDTEGAVGAARGAGVGIGLYASPEAALQDMAPVATVEPEPTWEGPYQEAYQNWCDILVRQRQSAA
ncbi:xylulokinase [Rhodothermus profundi]|uniref:Xylulokinase n=1 Tax=Rhodothermus profundi TaxID=633813 RepID=A0A1M6RTT3_9BACT|nr:FGGY family carbohydrate kinase [Rhodothermus profundi]SHK35707.1 xylulokinase [Rhodothermus profundi]